MARIVTIAAQNFREIGPVRGRGGKTLKPGVLFRSGDLSEVTDTCVARIRELGIRSMVDLRSAAERRRHPYEWLPAIDADAWGDPGESAAAAVSELLHRAEAGVDDVAAAMCDLYRDLPFSHAASYATLFRRVAEGRTPVLFGCAAGKDRTGVGAALLLWSIGVDFEAIFEDYLLTNQHFDRLRELAARRYGWRDLSPKIDMGLRAERVFLEAAIETVTDRCGGIDGYLEGTLGLSAGERAAIERELLG